MEIDRVLHELQYIKVGYFPREALEAAIAQWEDIRPPLLEALGDAPRLLERLAAETDYMLPFYAFYLLAQFRETRAYPLLVAFFSQPGELPFDVTSNFVTEDLGRVLASVSGGDPGPMKTLIEDPQVNSYTRSAAMGGLITLFVEGSMTREAIIAYCHELLQGRLESDFSSVWDGLISQIPRLYPEELMPEIRQTFGDDLIACGLGWIENVLEEGKERTLAWLRADRHYHFVNDTIREIEWWACFRPPRPVPSAPSSLLRTPRFPPPPKKKVGRNAPCPCGSGRKYKHCCGTPG